MQVFRPRDLGSSSNRVINVASKGNNTLHEGTYVGISELSSKDSGDLAEKNNNFDLQFSHLFRFTELGNTPGRA